MVSLHVKLFTDKYHNIIGKLAVLNGEFILNGHTVRYFPLPCALKKYCHLRREQTDTDTDKHTQKASVHIPINWLIWPSLTKKMGAGVVENRPNFYESAVCSAEDFLIRPMFTLYSTIRKKSISSELTTVYS